MVPRHIATDYPLEALGSGVTYNAASGHKVQDLGGRRIIGKVTTDGGEAFKGVKARVAEVTRGLLSVAEVVDVGGDAYFSKTESWIRPAGGTQKIPLERRGQTFELDMEIAPYDPHFRGPATP